MLPLLQLISTRHLLLLAASALAISWLYTQSTVVEPDKHVALVSSIRTLKQLDANLNQDILRSRYNQLVHYDPFVATLDQIRDMTHPLTQPPLSDYLHDLSPALKNAVKAIQSATEARARDIETFKSRNAVLKNSLRYFPTLTTQLVEHSKRARQFYLYEHAERLQRDMLILNLIGGQDMQAEIRHDIAQLRPLLPALPPALAEDTATLIDHSEAILTTLLEVDTLTQAILSAPLPHSVDTLGQSYDQAHAIAMRHTGIYRALLYGLSVLLLGYVFYFVVRTRLSALALAHANAQLHEEADERQRAQAQLTVYGEVIDGANDAIALLDPHLHFEEMNPAHLRLTECVQECDLIGQPLTSLLSEYDTQQVTAAVQKHGEFRGEIAYRLASGKTVDVEVSLFALRRDDAVQRYVIILRDISERKAHLTALEFQATHDMLTGLPNRSLLYSALEHAFEGNTGKTTLMLLDLDRFKEINDTLGHLAGDMVLRQVAGRIEAVIQRHGMIARLGGDEFAVMLPQLENIERAEQYAALILSALREPIELMELNIEIGGSIGIALHPDHGTNPSQLMRCADVAMYLAKAGGTGYNRYEPTLDQHTPRRLAIMTGLGRAIEQPQLLLHFQPKLTLDDSAVSGFEALIRWQHPEHGMIPPDQFIPLAEMSDLIGPLTLWVVDNALAQIKAWRASGHDTRVAVNFSARNFLDDDLPRKIAELLSKHGLPAHCFEVEITESAMMADATRSLAILRKMQEMGLRLAIDDYGTGHSSLAYLQRLPIHSLKIDLSFVRNMLQSKENEVIVHSTIQLAHNLGLNVIAEGVEDGATLAKLCEFECDEAQGYFISRPMPAQQATEWLDAHRASLG